MRIFKFKHVITIDSIYAALRWSFRYQYIPESVNKCVHELGDDEYDMGAVRHPRSEMPPGGRGALPHPTLPDGE